MVNRKVATIVVWLVPEAREKGNEEIAKEIREELVTTLVPCIPYAEKIEKVTVLSEGETDPKRGISLRRVIKELCWTMPKEALRVIIKGRNLEGHC